jgi:subtilase family serine protease
MIALVARCYDHPETNALESAAHGVRHGASRTVLFRKVIGFLLIAMLQSGISAAAQVNPSAVQAEFQTPARSLITESVDETQMIHVAGAVHPDVAQAQDLGPRDDSLPMEHIQLVLRRPQERQTAFDAQVEALHEPGSASYHQWLTPQVVGTEFGPAASDLSALIAYLRSEGFTINGVGSSGMFVDFTGTVGQVQQSFGSQIHNLRLANGDLRYGAITDAQLPQALASLVVGFASLSDIPSAHPNYRKAVPQQLRPNGGLNRLSNPLDTVSTTNYAVGPQDFYTIYNESALLNASTPINGSGVTIALLEESAINTADVTSFRSLYGVSPATPASLVVDTGYNGSCTAPALLKADGEEGEAILDVEWAGAVAPGANLLFMQCATSSSTLGIFLSAEAVIDNNLADIMSLSYGQYEGYSSTEDTLANNLWEQAAAQGQTVVVSAGDTGPATEDGNDGNSYAKYGITINSFSSTAWNVSAGGTDFQDLYNQLSGDSPYAISTYWNSTNGAGLGSAKRYIPEMTWNDTCASSIYNAYVEGTSADGATLCGNTLQKNLYLAAAGGGPSKLHARPVWQTGTVYGLPSTTTYPNRLQPDLSLFAANGFWYHDLPSYQSDESPATSYAGGTSFVAPQLAGIFALIKQATGERLGQPNYVLYNLAGQNFGINSFTGSSCNGSGASGVATTSSTPLLSCIFYDVQTGNNSVDCKSGSPNCYVLTGDTFGILSTSASAELPAFPASQGWDQATGIGSINITNLVNSWQTTGAGGTLYTPNVSVTATAASYTYGLPAAITYTATVSGSGSFPTGSVSFSGSGGISLIGTDSLVGSSGCSSGSTCTESARQSFTAPATLAGGTYTITGNYSSTNENYTSGSGNTPLTVTPQTPAFSVSAITISFGTAATNLSATLTYSGSGKPPTGAVTFQVDSGPIVYATCAGAQSPLICTASGYNTSSLATGNHIISVVSAADGNYATISGTNTLTVLPPPTISFVVPGHHTMDLPFPVAATSNSSGAISYSVLSGPATISGTTITLSGIAGTVVLQASQAASGSYAAGVQDVSFSVIAGSVWIGNGTGSLSALDLTGGAITSSSGFVGAGVGTIASPLGLAFDASGDMWVASSNGISEFTRQGVAISSAPYTSAGIASPMAIAVDGSGQVWVANSNGTVSVLSNTGAAISPSSGYPGPASSPAGIAIDIAGSVWVPSSAGNSVTRIFGAATPVVPLAVGAATTPGKEP